MSLSNPNKPVTEQRLQEFYHKIKPYMGGGGGGGGGDYTAGDGISIDANDEISADIMPSSDMEEVAYPLPGVRKQGIVYSTKEQVVGTWEVDGTVEPLYQKSYKFTVQESDFVASGSGASTANYYFNSAQNHIIDTYANFYAILKRDNGIAILLPDIHVNTDGTMLPFWIIALHNNSTNGDFFVVRKKTNSLTDFVGTIYVTIQYTKTTS